MSVTELTATADLCGPRILLRWVIFPDQDGADPRITVLRKQRDFDFPAVTTPYVIYDSGSFPPVAEPGHLEVRRLAGAIGVDGDLQFAEEVCSVARIVNGRAIEELRRTVRTVRRRDHALVRREVELLDAGTGQVPLIPSCTYYYRLDSGPDVNGSLRASASPTAAYRYHHVLYDALPAVYRSRDTTSRPADAGTGMMPEANASGGQLRRLIDVFGATVGALRSSADGLRGLRDTDLTDARYLPLLARWIGWNLTSEDIARRRNEIAAAPARYRNVGTAAGLHEIVDHYTGWSVRIGEAAQSISRSNDAPRRNVFAAVESADGGWAAPDDAGAVLGLSGSGVELTGTASEPFRLFDGMSMSLAVDGAAPTVVRFAAGDFTDPSAATAAEVAAAIAGQLRGVGASAVAGQVRLRSERDDDAARVAVVAATATLVALEGAPRGRLSVACGDADAGWLAYATTAGPGAAPALRIKPRRFGRFYDAQPIGGEPGAQADPAVAVVAEDIWCAWVSDPSTQRSRLNYRVGTASSPTPARLTGDAPGPFALTPDTVLVIDGPRTSHTFTVRAADYDDPGSATVDEAVAALNDQLGSDIAAGSTSDGRLVLSTADAGPAATAAVSLAGSTAARRLGFGARGLTARGGWDAALDWGPPLDVGQIGPGRHAECTAVAEAGGAVRMCWSTHDGSAWRLVTARWVRQILAATASGLKILSDEGIASVGAPDGLPADDVRHAVADADGTVWVATAAGAASRAPGGTVTTFTTASTAGGLPADDVRGVAVGPDGTVWCATAAGLGTRSVDGRWRSVGTSDGLPGNDIRAVLALLDGSVWVATASGVAVLRAGGWHTFAVPAAEARRLAVAADGSVWAATSGGVARIGDDGRVVVKEVAGLPAAASDVRDVACEGATVWLATAAGPVELGADGGTRLHTDDSIAVSDCRAVTSAGGRIYVGTASGAVVRDIDGRWSELPSGGPVVALSGWWSAPMFVPGPGGGEREPHLARDGDAVLLAASRRVRQPGGDLWQLTLRRREPGSDSWSDAEALTGAAAVDREPAVVADPNGQSWVYFRSNRGGGARIWRMSLTAQDPAPEPVTTGSSTDTDPVVFAGPQTLLLFRSDRSVAHSAIPGATGEAGVQLISQHRYAGSTTAVPADSARNAGRDTFDDLLDYTPQRPRGDTPAPDERHTPAAITVFFGRGRADRPLQPGDADRLRRLLSPFLPANVRAVPIADV